MRNIITLLLSLFILFPVAAKDNKYDNLKSRKLYLVGDSTVSSFNDTTYYYPREGYGNPLKSYIYTRKLRVRNLALSGRSSKSFLVEKNYQILLDSLKEGDILMIAFGHNDEKGEKARYTNPNTDITDPDSFKYSLYQNYIKMAQERGAIPILCTPIVRRSRNGEYTGALLHSTKDSGKYKGGDYAQAIRDLGKELNVTVIDNTTITKELYEKLGSEETLLLHARTSSSKASVDNTHTNYYGASYIAYLIAEELKNSDNVIKDYIKDGIKIPPKSWLKVNSQYVEMVYAPPTAMSKIWETTAPWYGTVFGDCGGPNKVGTEYYSITESGSTVYMRSGTEEKSAGKIASTSDGIAVYFQKVDSKKDFTLSVTATVKSITSNNQVSFGLMVRDGIWIDIFDASLVTSYVTAGPLKITYGDEKYLTSFTRVYNSTTGVQKQNSVKAVNMKTPKAGDVIDLKIVKSGSTYTVTYGTEEPVTYNLDLTDLDKDYIYTGLFTARQCEIEYSNIKLDINK